MVRVKDLTPTLSVAGLLDDAGVRTARDAGFSTIVNFLPDGDTDGQLSSNALEKLATTAGLCYFHAPASKLELFADETLTAAAQAFGSARGKTLAVCASGQRAAIVWAALQARTQPVDDVLHTLKAAGFAFDFIRDDLEAQADRPRWLSADGPVTLTVAA